MDTEREPVWVRRINSIFIYEFKMTGKILKSNLGTQVELRGAIWNGNTT